MKKESFNSDGQQFYKYQHNDHPSWKKKKKENIWKGKDKTVTYGVGKLWFRLVYGV
jgi:hypothetical protein